MTRTRCVREIILLLNTANYQQVAKTQCNGPHINMYNSIAVPTERPTERQLKPISHHRLRPDKTVLSGRVGIAGVNTIRDYSTLSAIANFETEHV